MIRFEKRDRNRPYGDDPHGKVKRSIPSGKVAKLRSMRRRRHASVARGEGGEIDIRDLLAPPRHTCICVCVCTCERSCFSPSTHTTLHYDVTEAGLCGKASSRK